MKKSKMLSREMISGPLGDVRHTAHVGSGEGDVFGDTNFLKKTDAVILPSAQQKSAGGSKASSTNSSNTSINNQSADQQVPAKNVPKHSNSPKVPQQQQKRVVTSLKPQKPVMTSQTKDEDTLSIYEGWKVDLNCENLLEDVLRVMDSKTELWRNNLVVVDVMNFVTS